MLLGHKRALSPRAFDSKDLRFATVLVCPERVNVVGRWDCYRQSNRPENFSTHWRIPASATISDNRFFPAQSECRTGLAPSPFQEDFFFLLVAIPFVGMLMNGIHSYGATATDHLRTRRRRGAQDVPPRAKASAAACELYLPTTPGLKKPMCSAYCRSQTVKTSPAANTNSYGS